MLGKTIEIKLYGVAPLVADATPANYTADTDTHAKRHDQLTFVGHVDNQRSFIPRQNPPICTPPLCMTISVEPNNGLKSN